ncbi:hypothetical protein PMAYCL1PPCAC_16607, partial [Pristionchus mayeri]
MTVISFERLYSSIYPVHFEKNSSKRLASLLSSITIIVTSFITMSLFSNGFTLFGEYPVAILDEKIAENSTNIKRLALIGTYTNVLMIFVFASDVYLNFIRKLPAIKPWLSNSYQRSENRRVILIILPMEIAGSLLALMTTTAQILELN